MKINGKEVKLRVVNPDAIKSFLEKLPPYEFVTFDKIAERFNFSSGGIMRKRIYEMVPENVVEVNNMVCFGSVKSVKRLKAELKKLGAK